MWINQAFIVCLITLSLAPCNGDKKEGPHHGSHGVELEAEIMANSTHDMHNYTVDRPQSACSMNIPRINFMSILRPALGNPFFSKNRKKLKIPLMKLNNAMREFQNSLQTILCETYYGNNMKKTKDDQDDSSSQEMIKSGEKMEEKKNDKDKTKAENMKKTKDDEDDSSSQEMMKSGEKMEEKKNNKTKAKRRKDRKKKGCRKCKSLLKTLMRLGIEISRGNQSVIGRMQEKQAILQNMCNKLRGEKQCSPEEIIKLLDPTKITMFCENIGIKSCALTMSDLRPQFMSKDN